MDRLLFELASKERMEILQQLRAQRSRLSRVAKDQKMSNAEASRHLQRLTAAKLVKRDADGLYGVSPFGALVMSELSGLDFVAKHRDYFAEYDTSVIPEEFVERLGELKGGRIRVDLLKTMEEFDVMIREAEEFAWILMNQGPGNNASILAKKARADFDLRIVTPESVMVPDRRAVVPATAPGVQKRVLEEVKVLVTVTEKHGGVILPNFSGRMDFTNINGEDPRLIRWCKDLFLYYWERAKPFRG